MSATNSIYMCFFCAVTLNFASFDHFVVYQDGDVNLIANHMNNTVTAGRGTGACSETEARPAIWTVYHNQSRKHAISTCSSQGAQVQWHFFSVEGTSVSLASR